ncbi:MAG: hypothetical protein LUC30_05820 [Clostridiales bacterium]|nr:hypothetical protein [Clostridiales bacterium]
MKQLLSILLTLALLSALVTGCAEKNVTDGVTETGGETASTEEEPDAGTEEPDAGTEEPDAGTEEPDVETEEPEAGTEEPDVETEEPDAGTAGRTVGKVDVTDLVVELLFQEGFQVEETTLGAEDYLYRADWVDELTVYPSPEEDDPEGEDGTGGSLGTVQIFHYADSQRAAEVAGGFDPADPSLFSMEAEEDGEATAMVVDFVAPIRLYLAENCIVLYCGDSQGVEDTLDGELGAPFAPVDE